MGPGFRAMGRAVGADVQAGRSSVLDRGPKRRSSPCRPSIEGRRTRCRQQGVDTIGRSIRTVSQWPIRPGNPTCNNTFVHAVFLECPIVGDRTLGPFDPILSAFAQIVQFRQLVRSVTACRLASRTSLRGVDGCQVPRLGRCCDGRRCMGTGKVCQAGGMPVSYTHLTLPTKA